MSRHDVVFDAFLDELQKEAGFKEVLRNAGLAAALTAGAGGQEINVPPLDSFKLPDDMKVVNAKLTNYCPCPTCCEGHSERGINRETAYGGVASKPGAAVAPDAIPKRSWLFIPGKGWVVADDTGGAMRQSWEKDKTYHIDQRAAMSDYLKPKTPGKPTAKEIQKAIEAAHEAAKVSGVEKNVPVIIGPQAPKGKFTPPTLPDFKQSATKDDLIAILRKYNQDQAKLTKKPEIPEPAPPVKVPTPAPKKAPPVRKPASRPTAPRPSAKKPTKAPPPLPFLP